MSTTIPVPADVAAQLRHALYADLARAGADLQEACSTQEPGDIATPVGKLRHLFAVLDDIGWSKQPPSPEALTIHARHLPVVLDTLQEDQEGWEWTAEHPQLEDLPGREHAKATAETIERFLATLPTQTITLTVPPSLLPHVREAAAALAREVAQAIDDGEDLRDCARRLHAIAALQDALGEDTEATLMLDTAEHDETLHQAVTTMLALMEDWITEVEPASRTEREHELRLMRQLAAQVRQATQGGSAQ